MKRFAVAGVVVVFVVVVQQMGCTSVAMKAQCNPRLVVVGQSGVRFYQDDNFSRAVLDSGQVGYRQLLNRLRNPKGEYQRLCVWMDTLSTFSLVYSRHRDAYSNEIQEISDVFVKLLSSDNMDCVQSSLTAVFLRRHVVNQFIQKRVLLLCNNDDGYTKMLARRLCYEWFPVELEKSGYVIAPDEEDHHTRFPVDLLPELIGLLDQRRIGGVSP